MTKINQGQKRIALITGASQGIGKAITLELARQGIHTIGASRSEEKLDQLQSEAKDQGLKIETQICDVTRHEQVKKLINIINKKFNRLDILVNNAGGYHQFGKIFDIEDEEWIYTYSLNVLSVVWLVKSAFPLLQKAGDARVVNLSSPMAITPGAYVPQYSAAKAALLNISKYMATQLGPSGIRVSVVAPGSILSDAWVKNVERYAKEHQIPYSEANHLMQERQIQKIPLGHLGTVQDIANAVSFLVSEKANWITGTCLEIDGGFHPCIF